MLRTFFSLLTILTVLSAHDSLAYDPKDYAETERATHDALVKATNEFVLTGGPHQAALEGYRGAVMEYSSTISIPSPSGDLKEVNILKQK
jgi:hypothetical protein